MWCLSALFVAKTRRVGVVVVVVYEKEKQALRDY